LDNSKVSSISSPGKARSWLVILPDRLGRAYRLHKRGRMINTSRKTVVANSGTICLKAEKMSNPIRTASIAQWRIAG